MSHNFVLVFIREFEPVVCVEDKDDINKNNETTGTDFETPEHTHKLSAVNYNLHIKSIDNN